MRVLSSRPWLACRARACSPAHCALTSPTGRWSRARGRQDVVAAAARGRRRAAAAACAPLQELDLDVEALLALHDEHELSALLAPELLLRHARRTGEPALHLPSTVWVLADLQPIAVGAVAEQRPARAAR